ncbi:MAG: hypothetical protein LBQ14_09330 [Treponema sp.]|jgi:hypothetical protein|nr:hypothetical protein [Treponema sp.]
MKTIRFGRGAALIFAVLLAFGSCSDGSTDDPFGEFNEALADLNRGTPSDSSMLNPVGLTGKNLSSLTSTGGYQGYDFDGELTLVWTGRIASDYTSVKTLAAALLGGTFLETEEATYKAAYCQYGGSQYECGIVFTKNATDADGALIPAGVIMVVFGPKS